MPTDPAPIPGATPTLADRLLGKIVMAGPATPCAVWVGAYNRSGYRWRAYQLCRPVVRLGSRGSAVGYVAPVLLRIANVAPARPDQTEACHHCPTGSPVDGVYRCVDLAHLRWGSRRDNERDKRS